MAKILSFRNKDGGASGQDFLTDENQTLSFRMSKDGAVSLGNIGQTGFRNLFPDPRKDWSNQELADLFRVRQLLSNANVPVETDRGITDEGDPWFVFCHVNGEVFIHLCRIDGLYILDSPNVSQPLRGADFRELIADFTNQALPACETDTGTVRRVIRLGHDGKVRLHPSAMLAALIWTLFLASEEIVLLAVEESGDVIGGERDASGVTFDTNGVEEFESVFHTENDLLNSAQVLKSEQDGIDHSPHESHHVQLRDAVTQQQGLTLQNNAFTMGLSTIAIAMGFMSETVLLDNQRKVLQTLKELGALGQSDDQSQATDSDAYSFGEDGALLDMLVEFLGLDLSLNINDVTEASNNSPTMPDEHALTDLMETAVQTFQSGAARSNQTKFQDLQFEIVAEIDAPVKNLSDAAAMLTTDTTLKGGSVQDGTAQALAQFISAWTSDMQEFQLGQATVSANFNIRETDALAFLNWLESAPMSQQTPPPLTDVVDLAQRLIEFVKTNSNEVKVLHFGTGFLLIDGEAVSGGHMDFMQWEADDGTVISVVGLASDFAQFDMIA